MAKPDYAPYDKNSYPIKDITALHIGVIRTEWNDEIVKKIHTSCLKELANLGLNNDQIYSYTVPGSFELSMGAKMMITSTLKLDAIICLGCVIQGQTKHDDYINHTIARSLNSIGLVSGIPVIFGVLTTNTKEQALDRAGGSHGDKGIECALSAIKMISLKEQLAAQSKKISF